MTKGATIRKFQIVQTEGKRAVSRNVDFYNFGVIISVGYRVNSVRATQVLRAFAIIGIAQQKTHGKWASFISTLHFYVVNSHFSVVTLKKCKLLLGSNEGCRKMRLFLVKIILNICLKKFGKSAGAQLSRALELLELIHK